MADGGKDGKVEKWRIGKMERWNINRGFKDLRVWQDAIDLYVISTKTFSGFPFELKKTSANAIDSAHSISRNIALGSSGEFHSSCVSFLKAGQISEEDFE